jgi:hypothetical protein
VAFYYRIILLVIGNREADRSNRVSSWAEGTKRSTAAVGQAPPGPGGSSFCRRLLLSVPDSLSLGLGQAPAVSPPPDQRLCLLLSSFPCFGPFPVVRASSLTSFSSPLSLALLPLYHPIPSPPCPPAGPFPTCTSPSFPISSAPSNFHFSPSLLARPHHTHHSVCPCGRERREQPGLLQGWLKVPAAFSTSELLGSVLFSLVAFLPCTVLQVRGYQGVSPPPAIQLLLPCRPTTRRR